MIRILVLLAVAYAAFCALMFAMQPRMLFLPGIPGRALVATPADIGLRWEEVSLRTDDGESLRAWWVPADGTRNGTVLIMHGNAGNLSHRLETLRIWHELGFDALIFSYRGYGPSTGRPSEAGTYRDAAAAWRHLTDDRGIPSGEIVLFGRSLGGAVAVELATHVRPRAVIVESAFSSFVAIGRDLYPWLPVRWLARFDYDSARRIGAVSAPVLIVHSPDDEFIGFHHAEALYSAANEPKSLLRLRGDHNTGFLRFESEYVAGLRAFLGISADRRGA